MQIRFKRLSLQTGAILGKTNYGGRSPFLQEPPVKEKFRRLQETSLGLLPSLPSTSRVIVWPWANQNQKNCFACGNCVRTYTLLISPRLINLCFGGFGTSHLIFLVLVWNKRALSSVQTVLASLALVCEGRLQDFLVSLMKESLYGFSAFGVHWFSSLLSP